FNADFDGDQMAVHLPLSDAAQAEARDIMAANKNLLKPADGSPILHIEQDIVLGCYYLTYTRPGARSEARPFSSLDEALMCFDNGEIELQDAVRINFRGDKRVSSLGRILFNEIFPEDFPFQDEAMTKKKLSAVMALVYHKYGQDRTAEIADDLKDIGFEYATMSGLSMGMDDFAEIKGMDIVMDKADDRVTEISTQYEQGFITDEERYRLTVDTWMEAESNVLDMLNSQFVEEDSAMAIAATSGARGNVGQVMKSVGMLGVTTDATGKAIELPIKSGYKQGLTALEYFTATRGARKGMIDTALKTADSGYLTRRLVDVAQDVFTIDEDVEDPGFAIYRSDSEEIGVSYSSRLEGRYAAIDIAKHVKKGELITKDIAQAIDSDEALDGVRIKSVLSVATARGIPKKCYGLDPATGELVADAHPIGVIAAQSIGEPGTQLTLRTFHSGGSAAAEDITQGLPRVEEIFEVRSPKGQAYLSDVPGLASVWEEGDKYIVQITSDQVDALKLSLDGRKPTIANGSDIAIGDVIAEGEEASNPLIAPMAGKVDFSNKNATISPAKQAVVRYEIPGFKQVVIRDGDHVVAGQRLTNGSINLHELISLQGVESTQRYIMNEILKIFASQGQNIADKHLEIIVRQMFGRVQIEESGDSEFVTGDVASKQAVLETNEKLGKAKKELIKYNQLLLGITKASLSTDSFLSAASFQDTTRVLIAAATSGKVDHLYGLKENVILGRRIPVGTGSREIRAAEAKTLLDEAEMLELA
ncbi:MAG: DNA-directed RNA polymerase subunit beta', partial [bacterium]|nr:DNA-directed RNA polymerase subunit beta' [bacterium]